MGSEVAIGMAAVPTIIAIVAVLRRIPVFSAPDLATVLTVAVAIAWHAFFKLTGAAELVEIGWTPLLGQALIVGLAASGLYSGATAAIEERTLRTLPPPGATSTGTPSEPGV